MGGGAYRRPFLGIAVVVVRLYGGTFFFWRREIGIGAGFCCDRVSERLTALGMVMNYRSSVLLLPVGKYHHWGSRGPSERVVYISIEGEKKVGGRKEKRRRRR